MTVVKVVITVFCVVKNDHDSIMIILFTTQKTVITTLTTVIEYGPKALSGFLNVRVGFFSGWYLGERLELQG